jgi:hypothetical protein
MMVDFRLTVVNSGTKDNMESLWYLLNSEPELRGRINIDHGKIEPDAMGGTASVLLAMAGTTAITSLARVIRTWLIQQRSNVRLDVSNGADGRKITITADHIDDVEKLLHETFTAIDSDSVGDNNDTSS